MASGEPFEQSKHLYLFEVLVKKIDIKSSSLSEWEREVIIKNPLKVRIIFSDFYDDEIDEVKDCKSIYIPEPKQVKCHAMMSMKKEKESNGKNNNKSKVLKRKQEFTYIRKPTSYCRRAGSSCLFPMDPMLMLEKLKTAYLYMMVYGSLGEKEDPKIIGQAKVDLRQNFMDSVEYSFSTGDYPTTANFASTCRIENVFEEETGKIEIYARLSCFGTFIISMFSSRNNVQRSKDEKKTNKKHNVITKKADDQKQNS